MIFSKSLAVGVFLLACVTPLCAQQSQQLTRPKVEGKVIFGSAIFDEDLEHTLVGGAVRAYVTKRISIEPEYLYLRRSEDDQDHLVQMNVAYDFTDPTKRFVPYVIGGAGILHNRGRVFGSDFVTGAPFVREISFTTWTASAGGGEDLFDEQTIRLTRIAAGPRTHFSRHNQRRIRFRWTTLAPSIQLSTTFYNLVTVCGDFEV